MNSRKFAFWVFSEVELPLYGVLGSWHVCEHIIILGAALPVHARRYGSSQGAPVLAFERNLQAFRPFLTRAPPAPGSGRGGPQNLRRFPSTPSSRAQGPGFPRRLVPRRAHQPVPRSAHRACQSSRVPPLSRRRSALPAASARRGLF